MKKIEYEIEYLKGIKEDLKLEYGMNYNNFVNLTIIITSIWLALFVVGVNLIFSQKEKYTGYVIITIFTLMWIVSILIPHLTSRNKEKRLKLAHDDINDKIKERYSKLKIDQSLLDYKNIEDKNGKLNDRDKAIISLGAIIGVLGGIIGNFLVTSIFFLMGSQGLSYNNIMALIIFFISVSAVILLIYTALKNIDRI